MTRSLWPREHGAYGQLLVPMAAALASGQPGPAALGLAIAATAAFLAHEPALVLAGRRGPRARTDAGRRARCRLTALLGLVAIGALGATHSSAVAAAAGAAALLGMLVVLLARHHVEKTLAGEVFVAAALAAAAGPVALASGTRPLAAAWTWLAWSVGFAAVTCAVHGVSVRGGRRDGRAPRVAGATLAGGAIALAVVVGEPFAACVPLAVAAIVLAAVAPSPRRLRQIGWGLMAATLASGGWVVAAGYTL